MLLFISSTDDFSFFAVLDFCPFKYVMEMGDVVEELNDRIPNKTKLIFGQRRRRFSQTLSETLQVKVDPWILNFAQSKSAFINILNKRWQTLDLVSMMRELKRSLHEFEYNVSINNSLSSLPRFISKEPTV